MQRYVRSQSDPLATAPTLEVQGSFVLEGLTHGAVDIPGFIRRSRHRKLKVWCVSSHAYHVTDSHEDTPCQPESLRAHA